MTNKITSGIVLFTLLFAVQIQHSYASLTISDKFGSSTAIYDSIPINDGPYIFIDDDDLIEKTIVNGQIVAKTLENGSIPIRFIPAPDVYTKVKIIAAMSDIHGQYDLALTILKNNKIIDDELNWSFGEGHLVIVGDIFDRGDKVTEILWFVYNLENQAKKSGGRVHYLLGNHEYMIAHNDLRYINEKYAVTAKLLETSYSDLYGKNTVLGRWLRSKSTIIRINDNVFVHGGISQDFINQGFDLNKTNQLMRESLDRDKAEMKSGPFYTRYYGSKGPIWYRGYFNDGLEDSAIKNILDGIKTNHIVVGHCSQKQVLHLYDKKVFAVDSSIKNGEYGEILFIEKNLYTRGQMNGDKITLE